MNKSTPNQITPVSVQNGCLSLHDLWEWTSLGRTKIYDEIKAGRLRKMKCGTRTFFLSGDIKEWLTKCQAVQAA